MIFTINAKDNVIFPVMKSVFKVSDVFVFETINSYHRELVAMLNKKGILYTDLKGALIPNQSKNKCETCFVFDSLKIKSGYYGYQIFSKLIPLMDKESTYSILCGDYIDISNKPNMQFYLRKWLNENMIIGNTENFIHSSQYYIVYFNRLTKGQRQKFIDGLLNEEWFVGCADVTHQTHFKSYISQILVNTYIKQGQNIIASHPCDYLDSENINIKGYPFTDNQFTFISISEIGFDVFLSYKIESGVIQEDDVSISLNALFPKHLTLSKMKFDVDLKKWNDYLFKDESSKKNIMHTIGYSIKEKKRFQREIKKKIAACYIYNLVIDREHKVLRFNVCVELKTIHGTCRRTTVALEYIPSHRKLRLITIT